MSIDQSQNYTAFIFFLFPLLTVSVSSILGKFKRCGGDFNETVFHLHGYKFYLVAYRNFNKPVGADYLRHLDKKGTLFKRNLKKPVLKDTIRISKYGVVALRFIADNPGYWILRDEHAKQWTRGLDVVLHVGDSCDTVSIPKNFPTCGSWTGPDFFLI